MFTDTTRWSEGERKIIMGSAIDYGEVKSSELVST